MNRWEDDVESVDAHTDDRDGRFTDRFIFSSFYTLASLLPRTTYITYGSLLHVSDGYKIPTIPSVYRILSRVKKLALTFGRFQTQLRSSKKVSTI